jgi:hypothetical protein
MAMNDRREGENFRDRANSKVAQAIITHQYLMMISSA